MLTFDQFKIIFNKSIPSKTPKEMIIELEAAGYLFAKIKRFSFSNCINIIIQNFDVTKKELLSNTRKREITDCKALLYKLTYDYFTNNVSEIARLCNKKSHATIINGIRQVNGIKELTDKYNEIIKDL